MPEKPLTVAAYAAGASLAAITLVYVFGPTFFFDGQVTGTPISGRKKGIVGLANAANDCFINSVLQALAGLGDLRLYLIREAHRRRLDDPGVYRVDPDELPDAKPAKLVQVEGLRRGIVTVALKDILDRLNERPIYRKTVSANGFVTVLERGFRQTISRQQQDAQEFLQVVAERLSEEYHAGQKARRKARLKAVGADGSQSELEGRAPSKDDPQPSGTEQASTSRPENTDDVEEDGFPLEGKLESQIECQTCQFKPKASVSSFVTLTLNVPEVSSTTLNSCFDRLFQNEYIEDFKCDRCRLDHAFKVYSAKLASATTAKERCKIESDIGKIQAAIQEDPEKPPVDVPLPDTKFAPKRRISRHLRITAFPNIAAIHLSRSIFDPRSASRKNSAKVAFPERLSLGGILDRRQYKLLGVVIHRGSHNSGHYESFRRQNLYPPYSTPLAASLSTVYSNKSTPIASTMSSPKTGVTNTSTSAVSTLASPLSEPSSWSPTPSRSASIPHSVRPSSSFSSMEPSAVSPNGQVPALPRQSLLTPPLPSLSSSSKEKEKEKEKERDKESPDTFSLRSFGSSLRRSRSSSARPSTRPKSEGNPTPTLSPSPHLQRGNAWTALRTAPTAATASPPAAAQAPQDTQRRRRRKKKKAAPDDRWWRISDEKVKESSTAEVLSMQREVYLLFYELEKEVV
ncbi:MAG: hypothetical protein M1838_004383 [Thelocarpon superellum]|nr:MAG: hypothetical protein M1838_004383 [Thelocarpon superellum]